MIPQEIMELSVELNPVLYDAFFGLMVILVGVFIIKIIRSL